MTSLWRSRRRRSPRRSLTMTLSTRSLMGAGPGSPAVLLVVGRGRRIPDWPYDLAAPVAHRAWTRLTWSRLVQVHGLVDCVRDCVSSLCPLVESPCEHAAQVPVFADWQTVDGAFSVHRQSVGHCRYATETDTHSVFCAEEHLALTHVWKKKKKANFKKKNEREMENMTAGGPKIKFS